MSKFTYTKNRVIIPLLLLSILSLSSATIYNGSNPPYLASSVTLPKNLHQPPTVTDIDHQASDYWWDGTLSQKSDQQQKSLLPNATLTSPLVPPTPTPTTNNKSIIFSTTTEDLDLPLSQNPPPPSSTQNQHSLRPYRVFSPFPGSNSEIFISPRFTTHFKLYCTHRHYETDNHLQLFNKFASQFFIMLQCYVFHLLTLNSFPMIPAAMEQPTEFKSNYKKFHSSVSEWTHSLDHLFIQAKRVRIFGLSIDPRNPLFYYTSTSTSLLSTPPYSPTPITLLPLSHTPQITPILYPPPTTTPSESQISTPQAPSPLQSGEYCQGTLDIVDAEGVIVGLLPKTQHTPHTPSSHILV